MHIPGHTLSNEVSTATLLISVFGIWAAFNRMQKHPVDSKVSFAGVTALIFAMQMLNFPILNGTSGHLMGGVLAAFLLGTPLAILSISLVLIVQCFFFADGGLTALGANILNMSLIGAGGGGIILGILKKKGVNQSVSLSVASLASVVLASLACSAEVAFSGAISFQRIALAMAGTHFLIGIGEAALTAALYYVLTKASFKVPNKVSSVSIGVAVLAAVLSPWASTWPDGLEATLFSNYQAPFIPQSALSTIFAGLIGIFIVYVSSRLTANILK